MRLTKQHLIFVAIILLSLVFTLSSSPLQAGGLNVTPTSAILGTLFQFDGTGFASGEAVALWLNNPDGSVTANGTILADGAGAVSFAVTPTTGWQYGFYSQVAHGLRSKYEVVAPFQVRSPAVEKPDGGGGASNCGSGNFYASGFVPGETAATWTTRPDGVSLALPIAHADSSGVVSFNFFPLAGWPGGGYVVVASGYNSKHQGVNNFYWNGTSLTGGGVCSGSGETGGAGAPGAAVITPKSIVNPQGPGVYLNTIPDELYYFDCNWKWRPMGGTIYFIVLGFKPGEQVKVSYEILAVQGRTPYTTLTANSVGNVSMSFNSTNATWGHYHWWFESSSAKYCGHYDPPPHPE